MVRGFWKGSPADRNGLRPGDEVLLINSMDMGDLTDLEISRLLRDDTVPVIELVIKEGDAERRVSLERETLFPEVDEWGMVDDPVDGPAYVERGISGIQWNCYWNEGSPVEQSRHYNNVIVSTTTIGSAISPAAALLCKSAFADPDPGDVQTAWEPRDAPALPGARGVRAAACN